MNVLILFSIKVCDNPEANSFKTFFCCFIFFLCGKIISPKIIGWFLHDYHILSVRNLDHIYHMKNWLVWCLTIFFQAAYCPREFHPSEVLSKLHSLPGTLLTHGLWLCRSIIICYPKERIFHFQGAYPGTKLSLIKDSSALRQWHHSTTFFKNGISCSRGNSSYVP